MAERNEIRSYDYVNHAYETVRDFMVADPVRVMKAATNAAAERAETVAAELHVNIAGLKVGTDIVFTIGAIEQKDDGTATSASTRIPIAWESAQHPRLFPLMTGELSIYPLTATETQLDFLGRYDPPLGVVGDAVNAVLGRRIAEASVHQFIRDVGRYLREKLT